MSILTREAYDLRHFTIQPGAVIEIEDEKGLICGWLCLPLKDAVAPHWKFPKLLLLVRTGVFH